MPSRRSRTSAERETVTVGTLRGASVALTVTGVIGCAALLLALVWPWLAWGYVLAALTLGGVLHLAASRSERSLEREVARVREQHRADEAPTGGY